MTATTTTVRLGDDSFTAYLAVPSRASADKPAPGIVILQEIFGINANMRSVADHFAALGYISIVPDLFWRQEAGVQLDPRDPGDRDRATALMKGLDQPLAVTDALAAAAYVRSLPECAGRVGAIGYCLGGKIAFLLGLEDGIDAAISYYGVGIQGALDRAVDLRRPLLLHIAEEDHLCPPDVQAKIRTAMAPLGPLVEIIGYPGVSHAFARTGGENYDAAAAGQANAATVRFLHSKLAN